MKLFFFRHADATWPEWKGDDAERPLTKYGRKQAKRMGKLLRKLDPHATLLLTSPLPRAAETAELAGKTLRLIPHDEPDLAPGFDRQKLGRILKKIPDEEIIVVGHEPDFSRVIADLTGARVRLPKGGLALVVFDKLDGTARLHWLLPPKVAQKGKA